MIDALGNVQSILVLGGTSDIAMATIERLASARLNRVVLAGRPSPTLEDVAQRIRAMGIATVTTIPFDAADPRRHSEVIDEAFDGGDIDVTLVAAGVGYEQQDLETNPDLAVRMATTNFVGAMSAGLRVGQRIRIQGHGAIVFVTNVAGRRPRRSTFVYGATQAGIDNFAVGLGKSLRGSGGRVIVIRVDSVRTKLLNPAADGPATIDRTVVASAIADGLRRRGNRVTYLPASLRTSNLLRRIPV